MTQVRFSDNANYLLDVDASVRSQSQPGNYSIIYWRVIVRKTHGAGHVATVSQGSSGRAESNTGRLWINGSMSYNFRNGSMTGSWTLAEGTFRVDHDSKGNGKYYVSAWLHFHALGSVSATTGWRNLPKLVTLPPPPRPEATVTLTQTSIRHKFKSTGDGGTPVREWQLGYGTNPKTPEIFIRSQGSSDIDDLQPGTTYYFWSRGRNDVGWGKWSVRSDTRTFAGARIKRGNSWRQAVPYVHVNGYWRLAEPYVKRKGVWGRAG